MKGTPMKPNQSTSEANRLTHAQLREAMDQFTQHLKNSLSEGVHQVKQKQYDAIKQDMLMTGLKRLFQR